jgi:sulfate adenylyltransferase subunit 1 (EFTu-like GTPase family)
MPWYTGKTLLKPLRKLRLKYDFGKRPLPVQYVIRPGSAKNFLISVVMQVEFAGGVFTGIRK